MKNGVPFDLNFSGIFFLIQFGFALDIQIFNFESLYDSKGDQNCFLKNYKF